MNETGNILPAKFDIKASPKISPVKNIERHSEIQRKLTYWVKYAGIIDGQMGILTKKHDIKIFHTNPNIEKNAKKINLVSQNTHPDDLLGKANKKSKSQNNNYSKIFPKMLLKYDEKVLSRKELQMCKKCLVFASANISKRNSISPNLSKKANFTIRKHKKLNKTTRNQKALSWIWGNKRKNDEKIEKLSNLIFGTKENKKLEKLRKIINNSPKISNTKINSRQEKYKDEKILHKIDELKSVADSFLYKKSEEFQNLNENIRKLKHEQKNFNKINEKNTGIPNPDRYNSYLITNYMISKKLTSTPRPYNFHTKSRMQNLTNSIISPYTTQRLGLMGSIHTEIMPIISGRNTKNTNILKDLPNKKEKTMKRWEIFRQRIMLGKNKQKEHHIFNKSDEKSEIIVKNKEKLRTKSGMSYRSRENKCESKMSKTRHIELAPWIDANEENLENELMCRELSLSQYEDSVKNSIYKENED